jgi:protein-disulfide isomerase
MPRLPVLPLALLASLSSASAEVGGALSATISTLRSSGLQQSNMGGAKLTDTVMFAADGTKVNLGVRGSLSPSGKKYVESADMLMPVFNPALAGKILSSLTEQDLAQSLADYLNRPEVKVALTAGFTANAAPFDVALKSVGKGLSMTVTLHQQAGFGTVPANRVQGNLTAPHVIRMYSDFQCPYCQKAELEALPSVLKTLPTDVRFEFHHVPLTQIHPNALPAAEASVCAASQGRFFPFKDALFRRNDWQRSANPGPVFVQAAVASGISTQAFQSCVTARTGKAEVEAELAEAQRLGIRGTPTVFVDGYQVADPYDAASYQALLDFVRAR